MNKDLTNRGDIITLINAFYDKVRRDGTIGYIFNQTIGADWSHHLPVMYDFWEAILFSTAEYRGNPIQKHIDLDKAITLEKQHFDQWLVLWNETVDKLYAGEYADMAKNKAMMMLNLIGMKVVMAREGKSVG